MRLMSLLIEKDELFAAFFLTEPSTYAGLLCVSIVIAPFPPLLMTSHNFISRLHERQADRYVVHLTGTGEHLTKVLKMISSQRVCNLTPHPLEKNFWVIHIHLF